MTLRDVGMTFEGQAGATPTLRDINLDVEAREFVAVVGPSGCGKSTLLNLLAGTLQPVEGEILFKGTPLQGLNHGVGYMTQKDLLLPWRDVLGNIMLGPEFTRDKKRARATAEELAATVGLQDFLHHYPYQLSGGMRKRVQLARLLAYDPQVLLLDEPFSALDAQLRLTLYQMLLDIWSQSDKTILFVTHDLEEAILLSDRVVVMSPRPGRIETIESIDLPRPRNLIELKYSSEFRTIFMRLWQHLAGSAEDINGE